MSTWPNRGASGGPCGGLKERESKPKPLIRPHGLTQANMPPRNPARSHCTPRAGASADRRLAWSGCCACTFLQQWYGLADEALEDALYDSQAMRDFVGIDLAREPVPDATTLLKFRRLLEDHDLTRAVFDEINAHLARARAADARGHDRRCHDHRRAVLDQERGQGARPGDAPDQEGQPVALRDEGAHRRGRRVGLVHTVIGTAANVNCHLSP